MPESPSEPERESIRIEPPRDKWEELNTLLGKVGVVLGEIIKEETASSTNNRYAQHRLAAALSYYVKLQHNADCAHRGPYIEPEAYRRTE